MALNDLAGRVTPASEPSHDWKLRVSLANFIRGLQQADTNHDGLLARLQTWDTTVAMIADPVSIDELYNELWKTIDRGVGGDFFLETGRDIVGKVDCLAVSFVDENALKAWHGDDPEVTPWSVHQIHEKANSLQQWLVRTKYRAPGTPLPLWDDADLSKQTAGRAGRALWVAPNLNEVAELIETGRSYALLGLDADHSDYCDLANATADLLGFIQHPPGSCLIAAVSRSPIERIALDVPMMGPSIVEGGTNCRWRHWAEDYGRTYHLDSGINESGTAEAVCRPLPLEEIGEFIFMGCVSRESTESDESFAAAIGVSHEVPRLLGDLHTLAPL